MLRVMATCTCENPRSPIYRLHTARHETFIFILAIIFPNLSACFCFCLQRSTHVIVHCAKSGAFIDRTAVRPYRNTVRMKLHSATADRLSARIRY
jgi:hypothetical protein